MKIFRRLSRSTTVALILSPVGILLISVTRLLIISNYNPVIASAIVSSGGYVNALFGTVIPLVPIFMPYIALALLFFKRVIPGILAFLATALISPIYPSRHAVLQVAKKNWQQLLNELNSHSQHMGSFLLLSIPAALLLTAAAAMGYTAFFKTIATLASLILIPFVAHFYPLPHNNNFYAEQLREPWLPAETITLSSHEQVIGYVLSGDGDWLEVLISNNRQVIYYHAVEIVNRQICQTGPPVPLRPLITLVPAPAVVPTCGEHNPGSSHEPKPTPIRCPPIIGHVIRPGGMLCIPTSTKPPTA
jgi:hypothetical protein